MAGMKLDDFGDPKLDVAVIGDNLQKLKSALEVDRRKIETCLHILFLAQMHYDQEKYELLQDDMRELAKVYGTIVYVRKNAKLQKH